MLCVGVDVNGSVHMYYLVCMYKKCMCMHITVDVFVLCVWTYVCICVYMCVYTQTRTQLKSIYVYVGAYSFNYVFRLVTTNIIFICLIMFVYFQPAQLSKLPLDWTIISYSFCPIKVVSCKYCVELNKTLIKPRVLVRMGID